MKRLRKIIRYFVLLLVIANVLILITGKTYIYKALYYNFANIDDYQIFDNHTIKKSDSPQPWKVSDKLNSIKMPDSLALQLAETESAAFLIARDDIIIYEKYWKDFTDTTYIGSFSMAKSYTAALIGIAIEEGHIKSVDQKVSDFLPEFKEGKKDSITIKHLLTMSSGLDWVESYANPLSVTTEAYYGWDLKSVVDGLNVEGPPGAEWSYKGGDTQTLAFILKKVTGKSLSEYLSEKIWQPIGCENDGLWSIDHEGGIEKASCCITSTARDYARFGRLFLNNGNWNGKQLVPEDYVKKSTVANGLKYKDGKCEHYGWQWWVVNSEGPDQMYYARGILGQYIIVFPQKDLVVVRLGKKRGKKINNLHTEEIYKILDWVSEEF